MPQEDLFLVGSRFRVLGSRWRVLGLGCELFPLFNQSTNQPIDQKRVVRLAGWDLRPVFPPSPRPSHKERGVWKVAQRPVGERSTARSALPIN